MGYPVRDGKRFRVPEGGGITSQARNNELLMWQG